MSNITDDIIPCGGQPPYADMILANAAAFTSRADTAGRKPCAAVVPVRAIHLETAAGILSTPPVAWRVKGILPAQGVAVVFGASGSGKSFVMLDLAAHIALGRRWFGCRVKEASVVYVNLESSGGLRTRLEAWEKEYEQSYPRDVQFVRERLRLMDDVEALANVSPDGGVVIIDTLHAAAPDLDENSSQDMGLIIEAATRLQTRTDGLVVLVHHSGKDQGRGARGHYSLTADADAVLEVEREKNGTRAVVLRKSKEGVDGMRWPFLLKAVPLGTDEDGDPLSSCVVAPDATARRAERRPHLTPSQEYGLASLKEALQEAGDDAVHIDVWRRHFYARSPADNTHAKKMAFQRARKDLLNLNAIDVLDDLYSLSPCTDGTDRHTNGTCAGGIPHPETAQTAHTPFRGCAGVPVPGDACDMLPEENMLCAGTCAGQEGNDA
ncbi:AAA family ATPase [Desulfovibrio piger]|uniref:AAA family ATPase n=1 Tax=Desulfovibrio piger TaxID=901 RepID=UPI0026EA442B|nr:AAA family ATPase [Desulfovibrio piger]